MSHSQKEMFLLCSEKWRMHYIEKWRSPYIDSPLFVGSAMDDAFSRILLEKKDVLTNDEVEMMKLTEIEIFDNAFKSIKHLGEDIDIATSVMCNFSKGDYEPQLLTDKENTEIVKYADGLDIELTVETIDDYIISCRDRMKVMDFLDTSEKLVYNFIHWNTLRLKGHFILEKYREDVLPIIHKVYDIQKKIELTSGEDTFIGYIDFIASFIEDPDTKYIVDNKFAASARGYDVEDSQQLTVYCENEETNRGAYIIAEKKLRKREPKHRIVVKKGIIEEEVFESVFDELEEVMTSIKNEEYTKNFESCFAFGKKCPYYANCKNLKDPLKNLIRR